MRRPVTVLAAVVAILSLAAPVAAQAGSPAPTDTLELAAEAPSEGSAPGNEVCGSFEYYAMGPGLAPSEAKKAFLSTSSSAASCGTLFAFSSPDAFNITGGPTATVYVGCEDPSTIQTVRIQLEKNKEAFATEDVSVGPTCSPGSPIEAVAEFDQPENASYAQEDLLWANVSVFGDPGAVENFHVLVGGNETKSTLTVPGLETAYASDEPDTDSPQTPANDSQESNLSNQTADDGEDENGTPGFGAIAAIVAGTGLALVRRRLD